MKNRTTYTDINYDGTEPRSGRRLDESRLEPCEAPCTVDEEGHACCCFRDKVPEYLSILNGHSGD